MKYLYFLVLIQSYVSAQTYGILDPNRGPDHGIAKNFSWLAPNGVPLLPYVRSEITLNHHTYSYIRTGLSDFKLSKKKDGEFYDIIKKLQTGDSDAMGENTRLLHVYENDTVVNIYSWGLSGYNFVFYIKEANREPKLVRFGLVSNEAHIFESGFDKSIKAIEFSGSTTMSITKEPTKSDSRAYRNYEFREDGVYLNGVFDPSVSDFEPEDVAKENYQKDPHYYIKRRQLHAEQVAIYTKEIMDAETARVAALAPQSTPKPSVKPAPPISNPEPTVAPSPIPKTPAATTEPEVSQNLALWLAGLVALFVMLLGYLGVRYIRRRA